MDVVAVHRDAEHRFSKRPVPEIRLLEGLGVEADAHAGVTVQHRSRVARDPSQPNLRQVHLLHCELFEQMARNGYAVAPGDLGENITTRGLGLLALPTGTLLRLGQGGGAEVMVTGLRNPCRQIEAFDEGLLAEVVDRDADGSVVRKAGVMGVVTRAGPVRPGDTIDVVLPDRPHQPLAPV